jgi:hypothetical protein
MGYQEQIFDQAAALGGEVDKPLAEARAYLSRADALNQQLEAARAAEEKTYAAQIEAAVTTGKLPPANGVGYWAYDSVASKQVVTAVSVCHSKAATAAREAGPAIFEALQRRVAGVVKESAKLAATVPPGVVDEGTAFRAQQHDTWTRLRQLVDTWTACFELLAVMQRAGWVDGPSHPQDHDRAVIFQRYLRPLSLPAGYWKGPGELRLAKAAASNAEPGMYPWRDALERWERVDRRQRPYIHMQVTQTHDSRGNVLSESKSPPVASEFLPALAG